MDLHQLLAQPLEHLLLGISTLLLLSILASKASGRLGVPALLLFLVIGMLAGSEGPGGIEFDYPRLAQSLGVVALTLILFSGGLETHWHSIRPVLWSGIALSTVGVILTAAFVAWFAASVLNFSVLEGMLLGAIISSTDAAAIFTVLRASQARLRGHRMLEEPLQLFISHPGVTRVGRDLAQGVENPEQILIEHWVGAVHFQPRPPGTVTAPNPARR